MYNDENQSEDEENVHLENTELDGCNPVEDPDAPLIFDSDEDDEKDYAEYLKTYKVLAHNEESISSEDGSGLKAEDKDDGGPEVVINKVSVKPDWYNKYQPDINNIAEEDDPNVFPEEDVIPPVDPIKMLVQYAFHNKQHFKKHLKKFCVIHNWQFKCKKSCSM
ncbi:uncharacterized protein LOC113285832 [Papaver somniferum]|uniref:uncharacterized protein LOC113285832 n=1 Tax=Papaver somniferum TaxID=3469 RepID=UPI000E7028EA|nr:uncharacterized protein LOC113285832 [Papaver somniferum]